MINIRRTYPPDTKVQAEEVIEDVEKKFKKNLMRSAYVFDAKLVDNLSNVIVNVITGRLRASHFIRESLGNLAVMIGVGTDYAEKVDERKNYMDITWGEIENRVDTIMGVTNE